MKSFFLNTLYCCLFFAFSASGNNIKVNGTPELKLTGDTVNITFELSWENSWRDKFNWDAAWVFVKYKLEGSTGAWNHLNLANSYSLPADLTVNTGTTNSKIVGVFVYRNVKGGGDLSHRQITLKAPLSAFSGVTAANIANGLLYVAVSAVEMVYVPYGAYYLGDLSSKNSLLPVAKNLCGSIPESADIVNNTSGYAITVSQSYSSYVGPNVADHQNNSVYPTGSWYSYPATNCWWKIDFNTKKTVRYFGISGATNYPSYAPNALWCFEGSNDDVNWNVLSVVDHSLWRATAISYPVQQSVKVDNPGAYRYYRIRFPSSNYIIIQNIAMAEQDLYSSASQGPAIIDNETARTLATYGTSGPVAVNIGVNFPKGYNGFYVMKYELSQEQYVSFLNMLSYDQQKNRIGNPLDNLIKGNYAFGDRSRPSSRNGICVFAKTTGKPAIFANNLNPAEPYYGDDDGQALACNFLTPADMLAYCDWAGLRPVSELEYEKACRRPYPQKPIAGEYAWNQATYNKINGLSDLVIAKIGTGKEVPQNIAKNVNVQTPELGPVRCGSFGASGSTQAQAGATYWGAMEMSGNVAELCYGVAATGFNGLDQTNSYGDGALDAAGASNVSASYWPAAATAANFALRGGSFASPDDNIRVSDRSVLSVSAVRDSSVGFRGVRGITGVVVDGGRISALEVACPGGIRISNVAAASCTGLSDITFSYVWYVQKPGSSVYEIIQGETQDSLWYPDFQNKTTAIVSYSFKRVASCQVGVKESNLVTVKVSPEPFATSSYTFTSASVVIPHQWGDITKKWTLSGPSAGIITEGDNAAWVSVGQNGTYTLQVSQSGCPSSYSTTINVSGVTPLAGATVFNYTGVPQTAVLLPGRYKIECWGTGGYSTGSYKSYGGYTAGEVNLSASVVVYVYVGKSGQGMGGNQTTFNGGTGSSGGTPGGGASDVRLVGGDWKNFSGFKSRIIVAAGGGSADIGNCGSAGGLVGYVGGGTTGGTQTTFGSTQSSGYIVAGFGYGGGGCGGGGGYYGGGASTCVNGAGGGSSFISGHLGCNAITETSKVASIVHSGQPNHYSGIYFTNTLMIDGNGYKWTNALGAYVGMPAPDGSGTISGNLGNGTVRITPLN